jgi:ACR3 family arsenite transporter
MGLDSYQRFGLHSITCSVRCNIAKNNYWEKRRRMVIDVYTPVVGKISIIALLTTLIVLFSFEGQTILNNPFLVAYLAAPNLMHYATMITWTYLLGYFAGWSYEIAIDTTLIGSSSHFEVAIAVATTLYGIGSGAALATVIGPLMEVPLMLSLVKLGLGTRHHFPRKKLIVV